jgi:hypothetical protein
MNQFFVRMVLKLNFKRFVKNYINSKKENSKLQIFGFKNNI